MKRGQGIRVLDEPTESKEGDTGENGGAPGMGVPSAVLFDSEPPLISKCCRVWIRCVK
jgi:hypothetical protein